MTAIPGVRYAKSGDFLIAYQVTGSGSVDLVSLQFDEPNIVGQWLVPHQRAFLEGLASFSRLIVMDRRGMGCSDRLPADSSATLENHVEDLLAVIEDAQSRLPVLVAGFDSTLIAMMAAATHPDRFAGLILYGPSPSWKRSDDMPWESSEDLLQHELGLVRRATDLHLWAEQYVRRMSPTRADDLDVISVAEALSALAGTPESWYWDQVLFSNVDVRELLPVIGVPTLVLVRPDATWPDARSARFTAEHIPEARLVELVGRDAQPWFEPDAVLAEIQEFVTGSRAPSRTDRRLATVLFTDIVGSTERIAAIGDQAWGELREAHNARVRAELATHGGREVDTSGDGFFATFDGPARAVACASAIVEGIRDLGLEVRAGIHAGEIDLTAGTPGGIAVHIGARVGALAGPSEVLVSQTVKDLVAGSGLVFEDAGEHELKGVPDRWHLYRVLP